MQKRKIMIITTGRADYGLLFPLIQKVRDHQQMDLQLIVTGSHLSQLHGNTIDLIKADGDIPISETVEMTMPEDTENAVCKAIAAGIEGFSRTILRFQPELIIVLGDRYELWPACMAAVIYKIPIAHIHGGETTIGAMDESIRHSVTKMSAIHFAALDQYAQRIIQMGEHPDRVFTVGAIGLDNIMSIPLLSRDELSDFAGIDFKKDIALMTYHPVTLDEYHSSEHQIRDILTALLDTELTVLITMPNADTSGRVIYEYIKNFTQANKDRFKLVKNLGQKAYLSAMKYSKLMIGNSSSGIIESASFKLPVVNIGDRQQGRFRTLNIIDCQCSSNEIKASVDKALSDQFRKSVSTLQSPYGDGQTAGRILNIIESIDLSNKSNMLKKNFYDLMIENR